MISDERIPGSSKFVELVLKSANETYDVDPLLHPKWVGFIRIVVLIEDEQLVKYILKHLVLLNVRRKN